MKKSLQGFHVSSGFEQVFRLRNMMQVVREDKTDNQDIDVEKQYGDLHLRVISGHIRRERYEDNGNEKKDVNPEQTGKANGNR
jgi:hypothetical protein